jgi:four helix bundle protein
MQKEERYPFEELEVWNNSMDWTARVYQRSENFPPHEQYGLTQQLRRSAVSVCLNISEGKGRYHKTEYIQFLYTARGSLYEAVTCLKLAVRLNYLKEARLKELLSQSHQIHRQLNGLLKYLKGNG